MTTTTKNKHLEDPLLVPFSWLWNPAMNTYSRVVFWVLASRILEVVTYGSLSFFSAIIFIALKVLSSYIGKSYHMVFVAFYIFMVCFSFMATGLFLGVVDLVADYFINWIYFQYSGDDPE